MKIKHFIINRLSGKPSITLREICGHFDVSPQAVHKHLKDLINSKKVVKIGKTRGAYYILNTPKNIRQLYGRPINKQGWLVNKNLSEDEVLNTIKTSSAIFEGLKDNIVHILNYAFTEMLNNAIEHSSSKKIFWSFKRSGKTISFEIRDQGVGVFANIMGKFHLNSELEALEELIKGKNTTEPEKHSGEGIFFTSKIADTFVLSSHALEFLVDNTLDEIFAKKIRKYSGTKVSFALATESDKNLEDLFAKYSIEGYNFDKGELKVTLFAGGTEYISRSQARRLLSNLEKYKVVVLDFKGIKTIGQGFADQVFRVFKNEHPEVKIESINYCETVEMMIRRALA